MHLNPNMDTQDKYLPYRHSGFFEDGRTMRIPPAGTVAWGHGSVSIAQQDADLLRDNDAFYRGKDAQGEWVTTIPDRAGQPMQPSLQVLRRGQDRFNIYCAPCHDQSGHGQGAVARRGPLPVPTYHDETRRGRAVGFIFDIITNGSQSGLMRGYRHQIPVEDRWAVVAYVRALQRSQHAALDDVDPAQRGGL